MASLLTYSHVRYKAAIMRLLKTRVKNGGRGSIPIHRLQVELARQENLEPVLGNSRGMVDTAINTAIRALRLERPPRLEPDKGDGRIKLT